MHGGSREIRGDGKFAGISGRSYGWMGRLGWTNDRVPASIAGKQSQMSTTHDIMESQDDITTQLGLGGDRIGQNTGLGLPVNSRDDGSDVLRGPHR